MKLILTKYAFDRYCEGSNTKDMDYCGFQDHLEKEAGEELHFLDWKGKSAVYVHQAYWCYELDAAKQVMTLTTCLGILAFIGIGKSGSLETARSSRHSRTFVS
ncbi:hypothetical protein KZ483_21220 [Paenibacillus sp. sptzw28]|uniref:hypothetical protein n=1 Tax=Paenibacillus sp. sptzw28 TaxID=715179 RepID=UPI001C6EE721|nr:hypothetical protein [Paenibacillus sp. sptzw28]QYR20319.1 hypothetical protein KZ483_21220 [Paenibacillus sp. sptzw28]